MRILIVEDDPRISSLLDQGMREEGYQTLVVADGIAGLDAALTADPDVDFSFHVCFRVTLPLASLQNLPAEIKVNTKVRQ